MLRSLAAALFLFLLAACTVPAEMTPAPITDTVLPPPVQLATFTPEAEQPLPAAAATIAPATPVSHFWQLLFPGAEVTRTDDGLAVLRHAPNLVRYDVLFEGNPDDARFLSQWLDETPQAMAGVNCGFYWEHEDEYLHMGLLELDGQRLAPVRAHWGAALIVRDGKAGIVRKPKKTIPPMIFGIQGWPTLLWRGSVVAELDETDVARRTAVGVDASGRVLWVVDPQGSTLRAFAQRLRQPDIGLVDAVNLDGGASTGLRWREEPGGPQSGVDSMPIPCVVTLSPLSSP
jgi:hypothetical protein